MSSPVTEALANAGHQVIVWGMQSIHPPFRDEIGRIHVGLRYDSWGSDMLENVLRAYKIDMLVTAFDVWLPNVQYIPALTKKLGIVLMSHITVNSYPLSPFLATFMSQANFLVAPSKFSFNTIREAFGKVFYIPHGVDLDVYKPLSDEEKDKMKQRLRLEGKEFIVLSVMRNKGAQKDHATLFAGWKMLLEKVPRLKERGIMICLTDPIEPEGTRLDVLRDRIGMTNNIKFIYTRPTTDGTLEATYEGDSAGFLHNANYNLPAEEMCRLYNIADCHVVTSQGESFNLPTIEAMACGIPCIFGNHTTGPELVGENGAGLLAGIRATMPTPLISDVSLVDPVNLMECMRKMYEDTTFRKVCSKNALAGAKKYDWGMITKKWEKLVDAVPYTVI